MVSAVTQHYMVYLDEVLKKRLVFFALKALARKSIRQKHTLSTLNHNSTSFRELLK